MKFDGLNKFLKCFVFLKVNREKLLINTNSVQPPYKASHDCCILWGCGQKFLKLN